MNAVAVIPARGGSKRIPRKNIKNFCGQPMIAYSIQAAQKSGLFDRIIVSTDDEEIAEVSRQYGAEIPFLRPKELADDFTGTGKVIQHCLKWLLDQEQGKNIEYVCCIYATAPFMQVKYLQKGFELLKDRNTFYSFSITSYAFPIQRSIRIRPEGGVEPIFPEYIPKRSQDLEEAYHDAGQFYWGHTASFVEGKPVFHPKSEPVILPRYLVQDIDTPEDWQQAEQMYRALLSNGFLK